MNEATWASASAGTPWSVPGANDLLLDRRPDPEFALTTSGVHRWYRFNLTALVQQWVDGTAANNGVLLRQGASTPRAFLFASAEHADPALHPVLVVRYH